MSWISNCPRETKVQNCDGLKLQISSLAKKNLATSSKIEKNAQQPRQCCHGIYGGVKIISRSNREQACG